MLLPVQTIEQVLFTQTFDTMTAFVSDLPGLNLLPVFDDAADRGFSIHFFGKGVITFAQTRPIGEHGEFVGWEFEVVPQHRERAGLVAKAVIYND